MTANDMLNGNDRLSKMKILLPVTWEVCGMVEVEANSIAEAMDIFDETSDGIPLPSDCEYVDGSFCLSASEPEYIQVYNPNVPIDGGGE